MSKWSDDGVILSLSKQGERGFIINALTNNHGRHLGWYTVRSKKTNMFQPGDLVSLKWNARLADQMGLFSIELIQNTVGKIIHDKIKLSILSSFCSLLLFFLPERQNCANLYLVSKIFLNELINEKKQINLILKNYLIWEINVLKELGFYFNLQKCAVSGKTQNLQYVSPKTGNAVSSDYNGKYKQKLLRMPNFLGGVELINDRELDDVIGGFDLNYYFFKKFIININYKFSKQPFLARNRLLENFKSLYDR